MDISLEDQNVALASSPKILLVEDEGIVALDIAKQLRRLGYTAFIAQTAERAMELANSNIPDLAVVDINLPNGADGIELSRWLKSELDIPVVFVTGQSDEVTIARAKHTEPWGYLVKPVEPAALHSSIQVVLHRRQKEAQRKSIEREARIVEKQMGHTKRLRSVGRLSGGIAHKLNNSLTAVIGNLELAKLEVEAGSAVLRRIDAALQGSYQASEVIRQLLAFARNGKYHPQAVDLQEVVSKHLEEIKSSLPEGIYVECEMEIQQLPVFLDRESFAVMFTQLFSNAQRAVCKEGGKISVVCSKQRVNLPQRHNPDARPGNYAVVRVADDGQGIDPADRELLFEPFFSTLPLSTGAGMGLSSVFGVMQRHGGWIELESVATGRTSFALYFPLDAHKLA